MHLVRYRGRQGVGVGVGSAIGVVRALPFSAFGELLHLELDELKAAVAGAAPSSQQVRPLPPVDSRMEVWASGVTYRRSREARMEESNSADVYARVYSAERPELFFKSVPWRVVTAGDPIGVRGDSAVSVPEPELAVVANRYGQIIGYTVCNDVSSRSIEGANPLYLPQAKVYAGSCALAPGVRPIWEVDDAQNLTITCVITRGISVVWQAETNTSQMHRAPGELVDWLFRHNTFPDGVVLSTGTGLAPDLDVTLQEGDVVSIDIDDVGTLSNVVRVGVDSFRFLEECDDEGV